MVWEVRHYRWARNYDRAPIVAASSSPLFIVGVPRSGTSLFYKCLCLHPDAAWISNWVARYPRVPRLAALNRLPRRFAGLQERAWFDGTGNAYVYGRRRSPLDRVVPSPVEGEPVFAAAGFGDVDADWAVKPATALRSAFATLTRSSGGAVLISKRIANNRRIGALLQAFPAARFLHIVRDGRAVARSLEKVDWWENSVVAWYGGTPADWRAQGGDPVELCARTWVEELAAVEAGLAGVSEAQRMVVRYEDALVDPAATLQRLAAFAGLGDNRRWHERAAARLRQPASPNGRAPAGPDDIAIEAVQREKLQAFGYSLAGT